MISTLASFGSMYIIYVVSLQLLLVNKRKTPGQTRGDNENCLGWQ